jgi:hypothetical protein
VAFTAVVSVAKLGEHSLDGRVAKTVPAEVSDDIRLPTTINTPPSVPLETEDPQPAVMRVVTSLTARTATLVVFTLSGAPVELTGSAGGEFRAAGDRAGAQDH